MSTTSLALQQLVTSFLQIQPNPDPTAPWQVGKEYRAGVSTTAMTGSFPASTLEVITASKNKLPEDSWGVPKPTY